MTAAHPRLSVVVPTYDTPDLTAACCAALEAGAVPGMETIVVDDGGTDGIGARLAERFPGVTTLRLPANGGYSRAANHGAAAARGDVLLLLNSDVEVDAGALAALLAAFDAEPALGVAGARLRYPDGRAQWSAGREPSLAWLFGAASGLPSFLSRFTRRAPGAGGARAADWVTGAALACRRAAWTAAGPLDEGFRFYGQDLAFCLKAKRAGFGVAVVPGFTAVHRHGGTVRPGGEAERLDPVRHLADLLRWAFRYRDRAFARRAALVMRAGLGIRLAARAPGGAFLALADPSRAAGYRASTARLREALRALSEEASRGRTP